MFNRIWKKFTFVLLIVAFVPIGYFGMQDWQAARNSVQDEALKTIVLNSLERSKEIERVFINAHADINYLRSSLVMQFLLDAPSAKPDAAIYWRSLVEREFRQFLSLQYNYSRVGLLDEYGNEDVVVFRNDDELITLEDKEKRNRLTAPYYVKAAQLDGSAIAAIPMSSVVDPSMDLRRTTLIRYATKIFDRFGRPRGIIYLDLNGADIFYGLSNTSFEQRRMAALVTHEGKYIFKPEWVANKNSGAATGAAPDLIHEFPSEVVEQILSGRHGVIADDRDNLFSFSSIYPQIGERDLFYVVFDRYPREFFAPKMKRIANRYIIGVSGAVILIIIVSILASRALTRNLTKLRDSVESIRYNRPGGHLVIKSGDEIEALARAFNSMADSIMEYQQSLENKVEERTRRIKQVERRLMQSEKLAAIGFLAAGVAHEVNNPISTIVTRLELIERDLERGKMENVKKDLEVLRNHARRIGGIATNLLTFSRETSKEVEEVDLNAAVERVLGLIEPPIAKKGINIKTNLEPSLPLVMANASGMEQIIYNIVYNAYQATAENGEIALATRLAAGGRVELSISDTGVGIPKEVMEHIFEPFYTTKDVGDGTGLGLSISYGLIRDFGGDVDVESEPSKGTVFTITLVSAKAGLADREKEFINV